MRFSTGEDSDGSRVARQDDVGRPFLVVVACARVWVNSPYEVRISTRAERDLLRLPDKIGTACVAFIFGPLAERAYRLGGELRGLLAGLRSARRGSYRIVYRVDDDLRRVDIVHIDHRGDVYREPRIP